MSRNLHSLLSVYYGMRYPAGVYSSNLMFRKRTIFILVFAMMTTFLAPARLVLACQMQSQATACPMMAERQKATDSSCCVKKTASPDASISSLCCCKMQSAPAPPSLPEVTIAAENPVFVLNTTVVPVAAPITTTTVLTVIALETSAPRGPPRPFAALRAPPTFS